MRHALHHPRQILVIVAGTAIILIVGCSSSEVRDVRDAGDSRAQEALVERKTEVGHDHDDIVLSALLDNVVDNDSQQFISGRCLCRQVAQSVTEFPCENVGIVLEDELGKVVRSVISVDGEFVFPAEKEKRYRLQISSKRHVPLASPEPTRLGDNVVLHLVEK